MKREETKFVMKVQHVQSKRSKETTNYSGNEEYSRHSNYGATAKEHKSVRKCYCYFSNSKQISHLHFNGLSFVIYLIKMFYYLEYVM